MASSKISYKSKKVTTRKQYNILIVDDDKEVAEMFKSILKMRGHDVTITHDCILCLNKCQAMDYDVIFMDYYMKDMNGVELINIIKNIDLNKLLISQLKNYCKIFKIKGYSNYSNKNTLIQYIQKNIYLI